MGFFHPPLLMIMVRTLIVGLGNPILGDDGIGWRVADEIIIQLPEKKDLFTKQEITIEKFSLGGLSLMEILIDFDYAVIIDALQTGQVPIGSVQNFPLGSLPEYSTGHTSSPHDTSLQHALRVGRLMGAHLPENIQVIGIEAEKIYEFSETLSPEVEKAIQDACIQVWNYLVELENCL